VDAQNRVVLKPVTIGRDYGSDIEIVQGLTANDNVVLSPPDSLTDHAEVRVAKPTNGSEVAKL
jgi:multidrug efflux pump subunit AcrA (membrane-fusion protein)